MVEWLKKKLVEWLEEKIAKKEVPFYKKMDDNMGETMAVLNEFIDKVDTLESQLENLTEELKKQRENPVDDAIKKKAEEVGMTPDQLIEEWFYGKES